MNRTRIKICGLTRAQDVQLAVKAGVDAIGFILHADSPRKVDINLAARLRKSVPAFVNVVGVFVDAEVKFVRQAAMQIGLDTVQLHGQETPDYVKTLNLNYVKALRTKSSDQVINACESYSDAAALLLDPYVKGMHGGTGQLLDETKWPNEQTDVPLILAGGLSPKNIGARLSLLSPYGVDINSGVETAPGIKSADALFECVDKVRLFDAERLA